MNKTAKEAKNIIRALSMESSGNGEGVIVQKL